MFGWWRRRAMEGLEFNRQLSSELDELVEELVPLREIAAAAAAYRKAETDGTPRMWRGKALQDLATALDAALVQIRALAPPDARASGASDQESKDFPP